jgi:Domain of unknown function (DUF1963)
MSNLGNLETILRACTDKTLAETLRRIARPAVKLTVLPGAEVAVGRSRFGGAPDLPASISWPSRDGKPLEFVAQLELQAIAKLIPGSPLPSEGRLFFFYDWEESCSGQDPQRLGRVLHHAGDDLAKGTPLEHAYPESAIRPEAILTVPDLESAVRKGFIPPALEEVWNDTWFRAVDALEAEGEERESWVLGHSTEEDGDNQVAPDDLFLLQAAPDPGRLVDADYSWGPDNEPLFFVISPDELRARRFESVRTYLTLARS